MILGTRNIAFMHGPEHKVRPQQQQAAAAGGGSSSSSLEAIQL
jgi:hypothetical protein